MADTLTIDALRAEVAAFCASLNDRPTSEHARGPDVGRGRDNRVQETSRAGTGNTIISLHGSATVTVSKGRPVG